jgi:Putative DNA-binding domain
MTLSRPKVDSPKDRLLWSADDHSNADLDDFINEPRETLDVEVKEWLDLTDNDHRAIIAKEIIALANHGGGFLVIGFEERADGTFQPSAGRPANLDAWSQDSIQSIVAKYADPGVQCGVHHRADAASREKYPIIAVPGGHRVPIRAKAGSPDGKKLVAHRVYIRRPGPASEEPKTAEEWDRLQNRQAELLEAMRSIMAGVIPSAAPATPTRFDQLKAFETQAIVRWEALVAQLPAGVPPTFPHGYYDLSMAIDGDFDRESLSDLRDTIRRAVRNHSGWPAASLSGSVAGGQKAA